MKFSISTLFLLASGSTSALSAVDESVIPMNHPNRDMIAKFRNHLSCPYADQWLTKGAVKASEDLKLAQMTSDERHLRELQGMPDNVGEGGGGMPPFVGGGGPPGGAPGGEQPTCIIAPGPIGAGHMASYSHYKADCEGFPAESSPYMWPVAWSAETSQESMQAGSDEILYTSNSLVYYRLDKNWKRSDTLAAKGVQRNVGQGPCDPEKIVPELSNGPLIACNRTSDERTTMIHRGNKMMFIDWNENTTDFNDAANIASCRWLDLAVVGNIRPDWYMDGLGDQTSVQYMGDQHVYYEGKPRLVKQWRKTDFADMYFVMSMLANPGEDGIHWPLILDVPGEGFGDDHLRQYNNHALLTDEDDHLFMLDVDYEALGNTCVDMSPPGSGAPAGGNGPPVGETDHIPSNLEVEDFAWFPNEYTFSPVWVPETNEREPQAPVTLTGMALMEQSNVRVLSCYHEDASAVELHIDFVDVDATSSGDLPWMAIGYRPTEECLMIPRGGGESEVIFLTNDETTDTTVAHKGSMTSALKSFDNGAIPSVYESMTPLADVEGYSDVHLVMLPSSSELPIERSSRPGTAVTLKFTEKVDAKPEAMNFMYAIGSTPMLGYHSTRACFQVTDFPACPAKEAKPPVESNAKSDDVDEDDDVDGDDPSAASFHGAISITVALSMFASLFFVF